MGVPSAPERRGEIATVADVELLVRRFYQAVIPDPLLGPIFHEMRVDWSARIPKLVEFWSGRLLGHPGYEGNPVAAHQPVLDHCPFGTTELARWVELWEETIDELFTGDDAALAKQRARAAASATGTLRRGSPPCRCPRPAVTPTCQSLVRRGDQAGYGMPAR